MTIFNKLKDSLSQNARSSAKMDDNIRFCTEEDIVDRNVTLPSAQNGRTIALLQLRTLSVHPFSFPFGKNGRVRDALKMSFRYALGNDDDSILMIPQVTEQGTDKTEGVVWFVSKTEIEETEGRLGDGITFWPAPLALFHETGGNGLAIWNADSGTSGMLFKDRSPLLYRWTPSAENSVNDLEKWFIDYSRSADIPIDNIILAERSSLSARHIQKAGRETLRSLTGSVSLDLSTKSADSARKLEFFFAAAFSTARSVVFLGLLFLVLSAGAFFYSILNSDHFEDVPFEIYGIAFGERSNSPLASSAARVKNLGTNGTNMSLEQTLDNIAAVWKTSASTDSLKLDAIRYGTERTEIQGTATGSGPVESLRDSLNKNGFNAKISDIQQIPGSGMRFSIGLESSEGSRQK